MFRYFKDLPHFIVDPEQELEFIRRQVEHNTSTIVDEIHKFVSDVEASTRNNLQKHFETIKERGQTVSKLNKKIQELKVQTANLLITKDELEVKLEKEKQALQEDQENVTDDEKLRKLCEEATSWEQSIEKRKRDLKAEYAGFKRAVSFYVNHLGCKITEQEPGIILFNFGYYGALKSKEPEFYVKLQTPDEGKTWKLIGMNPDLACREKLAKRLEETNDTQGLLAYVRTLYKPLMDKREAENNENVNTANKS